MTLCRFTTGTSPDVRIGLIYTGSCAVSRSGNNTYQDNAGNTAMGGTWNKPTAIYTPRLARLNFTVTF